jgi:exosortase A-associated hydrolase 1
MASRNEQAVCFQSAGETRYGILHAAEHQACDTGVVILVGGPQYRVGSHRQFVHLARNLANQGVPVFRFDFSGMGDSEGDFPGFERLDEDVRRSVDTLMEHCPQVKKVVLWGLCDGASAACFYAPSDARVVGLALANPWVRTEQGEAKAFIKHYYWSRLTSAGFWRKLFSGKLGVFTALEGLFGNLRRSAQREKDAAPEKQDGSTKVEMSLPERVFLGLETFAGNVLLIISGNDLTAAEFMDAVQQNRKRQKLIDSPKITVSRLSDADHTFSRRCWKEEVAERTAEWIDAL